jgi:hypothetical protein
MRVMFAPVIDLMTVLWLGQTSVEAQPQKLLATFYRRNTTGRSEASTRPKNADALL